MPTSPVERPSGRKAVSSNREFLGAGLWAPVLEYLKASPVVLALGSPVGRGLCEGPPSAPGVIQSRSEGAAFPAEEGPVCGFLGGVPPPRGNGMCGSDASRASWAGCVLGCGQGTGSCSFSRSDAAPDLGDPGADPTTELGPRPWASSSAASSCESLACSAGASA